MKSTLLPALSSHLLLLAVPLLVLCPGSLRARDTGLEPDGRIGPFELTSANGHERLGIGFVAQLRFELTNTGGGLLSGEERSSAHAFKLWRARSLMRAALLNGTLRLGFQLSTAPGSVELMDLWADYRFLPALRLRLGQFKTPFGRHRDMSFTRLVLVDWPVAAQRFGAERQIGVMLHGSADAAWSYAAGVFTGTNARASFETGLSRIYGEPLPNPSNLLDPAPPGEIHPEIVVRVAHGASGVDAETNSDARGGGFRHFVSLGVAYDFQPTAARDFSLRLSPEVLLKVHHLSLNVVGYLGFFEKTDGGSFALGAWGLIGEAAWRFAPRWELALRYSRVELLGGLRDDARGRAAALTAAASADARDALRTRYASAGVADTEQELAVGFNVYLIGHSLKWQTDLAWLRSDGSGGVTDELRLRTQAVLAF